MKTQFAGSVSARRRLDPHTKDRPEPIEILARMAGRTNFITPKSPATNVVPVTALDIAHAIATAADKLGSAMAMAMACQRPHEWPTVEERGYQRVLHHLRSQNHYRGIVDAPYTYRARIAMYDAFGDLVAPARRRNLKDAAADARMRRAHYCYLLDEASAVLEASANTAARDAVNYLFALAVGEHQGRAAVSLSENGCIRVWRDATMLEVKAAFPDEYVVDVDLLCADVLKRPPRPGTMTLQSCL